MTNSLQKKSITCLVALLLGVPSYSHAENLQALSESNEPAAQKSENSVSDRASNSHPAMAALTPGESDTRKLRPGDKLLVFDFSNSQINSFLSSNPKPLVTATAVSAEGTVSYPPLGPTVAVPAAGTTLRELSKKFTDLERGGGVVNPNVVAILRRPDIPDFNPRPREAEIAVPPLSGRNAPDDSALLAQAPAGQSGVAPPFSTGGSVILPESAINGSPRSVLSTALNSQLGVSMPGGLGTSGLNVAQQLINMSNPGSVQSSMILSGGTNGSGSWNLAWERFWETIPGAFSDSSVTTPGESWSSTESVPGQPGIFIPPTIEVTGWVIPRFRSIAGEPGERIVGNFRLIVRGGSGQHNPLVTIEPGSALIRWFEGPGRWGDRWLIISRDPGEPFTTGGFRGRWIPGSFTIAIWPGQDPWREIKPGREIVIKGKEPWWEWSGWKEGDQYVPGYSTFENQMDPRLKKGLTGTDSYAHPGTPDDYLRELPKITEHPGWPRQVFVSLKLPKEWWEAWQRTWPGPPRVTAETDRPWNPPWRFPVVDPQPGRVIISQRFFRWPGININLNWRDWNPGTPGKRWWWLESGWKISVTPGRSVPATPPSSSNLLGQSPPWTVHNSVLTQAVNRDTLRPVWLWTDNNQPYSILSTALDVKEPFEWGSMASVPSPFTLPGFPGQSIASSSSGNSSSAAGGGGGGGAGGGMVSFVPAGGQGAGGGGGGGVSGGCLCGLGSLNGEFDNSVSNTVPELSGLHVKIQAGILTLARLATGLGGGRSIASARAARPKMPTATRAAGVVLGARAQGGGGTKITGQVFFSTGGPAATQGSLDVEELIDVNGLDSHQFIGGRIVKADKEKVEIATKQGKHIVIATADICSIRSPRVVNFNIPLNVGQSVDAGGPFNAKTGPIEFCRSESALRAIQRVAAHIENDEPIRIVERGTSSEVRPLVAELKGLLEEIGRKNFGDFKVISMSGARRLAAAASSANSHRTNSDANPTVSPSELSMAATEHTVKLQESSDEKNVEWCRDFIDWWQTEGMLVGGDPLERISRLIGTGLQGADLVKERNRMGAPRERLDQLIGIAGDLLASKSDANNPESRAAGLDENDMESFPIPFNEKGTVVRACGGLEGDPCTVRFCTEDNRLLNVTVKPSDLPSAANACSLGSHLRFAGPETAPDSVTNASSLELQAQDLSQLASRGKLWSVQEAHHAGILDFALKGDGKTVDHCRILMTNQSCKPLRICVPEGQYFLPDKPTFQIMMMTEDRIVDIPAGSSVWLEVATLGASVRKFKRPPPAGVCYRPDCYPDPQAGRIIQRTWEWANYMNRCQAFSRIATLDASKRAGTIAQIAVWRYLYRVAELAANDKITRDTVQGEYFPPKKNAEPIYPEKLVDKLWAASDLVAALAKKSVAGGARVAGGDVERKISILPSGKCGCGP